jgi:hypothetical protein
MKVKWPLGTTLLRKQLLGRVGTSHGGVHGHVQLACLLLELGNSRTFVSSNLLVLA